MDHSDTLEHALQVAQQQYPHATRVQHAAFANSVSYLVSGASGGYGGPSLREHLVSHTSAHQGRLAGTYTFDEACAFAAPLVFHTLTDEQIQICRQYLDISFDNTSADEAAVAGAQRTRLN